MNVYTRSLFMIIVQDHLRLLCSIANIPNILEFSV